MADGFPTFRSIVLDTTDARALAEFYRQLLGYEYEPGDEPPPPGEDDPIGRDWLVLNDPVGRRLAFQQVDSLAPSTWPADGVPQQLHLDFSVETTDDLIVQRDRAIALGAGMLDDRFADPEEPLYVFADPAGHPFCIFVVHPT